MKSNWLKPSFVLGGTLLFSLLAPAPHVSAAVIALYPFDTITSGSTASTDSNTDSVASNLTAGAGVTMIVTGTGNPGNGGAMQLARATTAAAAVTANDYWEFTLTPNGGFELDLTSLTLQYMRSSSVSSPTTIFVRSSLDSYATDLFSDSSLSAAAYESGTLTLSSLSAFQDLTSAITFRIYGFGATTDTSSLRVDNLTLNGTLTAVPEPSALALFLGGIGVLASVRFFRRDAGGKQ